MMSKEDARIHLEKVLHKAYENVKRNDALTGEIAHTADSDATRSTSDLTWSSSFERFCSSLQDPGGNAVRITIGCRTTVFHIATSFLLGISGNANGSTTVGNSKLELRNAASFMLACEALVVTFSVLRDMLCSNLAKSFANFDDG